MPISSPKPHTQHLECISHADPDQCGQSCRIPRANTDEVSAASTRLPLLGELLDLAARADFAPKVKAEGDVDVLGMFTQYLLRLHCLESLEFVLAIMNFVLEPDRDAWEDIYDMFIQENSLRELNIPASIKQDLMRYLCDGYPDPSCLLRCKKFVYDDVLINLYHEFLKDIQASLLGTDHVLLQRKMVRAGVEYSDLVKMDLRRAPHAGSSDDDDDDDDDDDEDDEAEVEDEVCQVDDDNNNDADEDTTNQDDEDTNNTKQSVSHLILIKHMHEPEQLHKVTAFRRKSNVTMESHEINADAESKTLERQSTSYSHEVCTLVNLIKKRVSMRSPFRKKRFRTWCRWPDECGDHELH